MLDSNEERRFTMADSRIVPIWRKLLVAALVLLVTCATLIITAIFIFLAPRGAFNHTDFFAIWSFARFEIENPAALIYDHKAQQDFLLSLDPTFPEPMPFPYPPIYLFVLRPLGWLSYPVARTFWSATTFLAYMAAVCSPGWRLRVVLPALLSPASAINLVFGQNGFLTAALLIGGIRLAPSRPFAGGILLGLLAYKPQFGLLVAIALFAGGLWQAALAAALTVAVAVAASLFAFGWEAWTAWVIAMPDYLAILNADRARLLHFMPTVFANMVALGASDRLAETVQFVVTATAAAAVWLAFRRAPATLPHKAFLRRDGKGDTDRAAVLAVAAVLASPYALVYDLPLVGASIALVVAEYGPTLSVLELLTLGAAALLPAGMALDLIPPISATGVGLLLGLILLRCRGGAQGFS